MKISSLLKQSQVDWEGRTTAVVFTKGCNFRCSFCHNPELVLPHLIKESPTISENEVLQFLESRKNWLDGVVITGGEPCIQKDLGRFIRKVKNLGLPVKLDTNGSNPKMLQSLIDQELIDYVAMDIKCLFDFEDYKEIASIKNENILKSVEQSLQILRFSGMPYQLRTTVVPGFHTEADIQKLKEQFKEENFVLQEFRDGNTVGDYL